MRLTTQVQSTASGKITHSRSTGGCNARVSMYEGEILIGIGNYGEVWEHKVVIEMTNREAELLAAMLKEIIG